MVPGQERQVRQQRSDESLRPFKWVEPRVPRRVLAQRRVVLPFVSPSRLLALAPLLHPRLPFGSLSYNALQKRVLSCEGSELRPAGGRRPPSKDCANGPSKQSRHCRKNFEKNREKQYISMQIKIFTIPLITDDVELDKLNHFLRAQQIIDVKRELAQIGTESY